MAKKKKTNTGLWANMWSLETETRAGKRNYRSCIMLLILFLAIITSSGIETIANAVLTYFGKETLSALSSSDTKALFYILITSVIACPILLYFIDGRANNSRT